MTIPKGSGIGVRVLKKVAFEIFKGQLSIVVDFVKFGVAQDRVLRVFHGSKPRQVAQRR